MAQVGLLQVSTLEKILEENPDDDFVIPCEGGTDFCQGRPTLYKKHMMYGTKIYLKIN